MTQLPFYIGREQKSDDGASIAISEWLYLNSVKISRHHATVRWDMEMKKLVIESVGKNGIDVDKDHIASTESTAIAPCSLIRIGPCFMFFLLPQSPEHLGKLPTTHFTPSPALESYLYQRNLPDVSLSDAATPQSEKKTVKRVQYNYKSMIQRVFDGVVLAQYRGFFTVPMLLHYIPTACPNEPVPAEKDYMRKSLRQALSKPNSGFVQIPPEAVPPDVVASSLPINTKRVAQWYAPQVEGVGDVSAKG